MFVSILIAILCGISSGIFTGLIPGVHVNLITAIVVSSVGVISGVSPLLIAIFILCLALTHSFLDSIPSIYLGAPDESQVLSVLPGHKLLLEGRGHHAVVYTLIGSFAALLLTIFFFPLGFAILEKAQVLLEPYIGKLLFVVIIVLLIMSKKIVKNTVFFCSA